MADDTDFGDVLPPGAAPAAAKTDATDFADVLAAQPLIDKAAGEDAGVMRKISLVAGGVWKFVADAAGLPGDYYRSLLSGYGYMNRFNQANADQLSPEMRERLRSSQSIADTAQAVAGVIPGGDYIRDFVPNTYNAAAAAMGSDSRIEPVRPRNREERTYQTVGENIGATLSLGFGVAARGADLVSRGRDPVFRLAEGANLPVTPIDRILSESGRRLATSPLGLATAEAGLGVAAGVGQDVGERIAERPDMQGDDLLSSAGRSTLPVIGNILGGGLAQAVGTAARATGKAVQSITPYIDDTRFASLKRVFGGETAEDIAAAFLRRRRSGDVSTMMDNFDAYSGEIGSVHSAAQQAADDGILSLERAILSGNPGLARQREAALNAAAQRYASRTILGDDPALSSADAQTRAAAWFQGVAQESTRALDRLVEATALKLNDDVAALGPKARPTEISAMATAGAQMAYRDARRQETALWAPLRENETVKIQIGKPLRDELDRIATEAPKAADPANQPRAVANLIRGAKDELVAEHKLELDRLLGEAKAARDRGEFDAAAMYAHQAGLEQSTISGLTKSGDGALEEFESIREVMALYSRLGKLQREASAGSASTPSNSELATNYGRLREVILSQIGETAASIQGQPIGRQLAAAREYSVKLNDAFTRGPMARLLVKDKRGGGVDPRTVLEEFVSPGGVTGAARSSDMLDAEAFANAARQALIAKGQVPEGAVGTPVKQLAEGYMADLATRLTVKRNADGTLYIDPAKLEQFQTKYAEQLDLFPNLKANLADKGRQSEVLENLRADREQLLKAESETGRNALALWLKGDPDQALASVLGNRTQQGQMMRELVKQASRDPDGQALPALRKMFFDEMMADARIGGTDTNGLRIMTSNQLEKFLDRHAKGIDALFSGEQQSRLRTLLKEVRLGESTRDARAFAGDSPTAQTQLIRESMDAPALGTLIRASFSGLRVGNVLRSLPFVSNLANEADRQLTDKVMRVVGDALTSNDPALFKHLMLKPTPENVPVIRARLRSYLLAPATSDDSAQ